MLPRRPIHHPHTAGVVGSTVSTSAIAAGGDGASDFAFGRVGEVTSNYADASWCAVYVWTSAISDTDRAAVENAWISALGID